jgi:exonuclease VII small subunit
MRIISNLRLSLAAFLLILGIIATYAKDREENKYELQKKSIYLEIRTELENGEITLDEAQTMWRKKIKQLKKEEGK